MFRLTWMYLQALHERIKYVINTLNAELNPICQLLPLLGVHHILHVRKIRVKNALKWRDIFYSPKEVELLSREI